MAKKAAAPKPGKKICPKCGEEVGARTRKCPGKDCDHIWEIKSGGLSATDVIAKEVEQLQEELKEFDEKKKKLEILEDTLKRLRA